MDPEWNGPLFSGHVLSNMEDSWPWDKDHPWFSIVSRTERICRAGMRHETCLLISPRFAWEAKVHFVNMMVFVFLKLAQIACLFGRIIVSHMLLTVTYQQTVFPEHCMHFCHTTAEVWFRLNPQVAINQTIIFLVLMCLLPNDPQTETHTGRDSKNFLFLCSRPQ